MTRAADGGGAQRPDGWVQGEIEAEHDGAGGGHVVEPFQVEDEEYAAGEVAVGEGAGGSAGVEPAGSAAGRGPGRPENGEQRDERDPDHRAQ